MPKIASSSPSGSYSSVWSLLTIRGMPLMLSCIFLLWFNVMALEPTYQPYLTAPPYGLSSTDIGLVLSAATGSMVMTMALSGLLSSLLDAYTQQSLGFIILCTALPFLGPTAQFHLAPSLGLFISAIIACYVAVGVIGPTQSVLCLRILSDAGLSQHDVAAGLAAANVTFSMLGSLCGPLVSGAIVPDVLSFQEATSAQAAVTALVYLPALCVLHRYRPGGSRRPPCAGCIACCSCLNSCLCPCCKCCQQKITEPSDGNLPQPLRAAEEGGIKKGK